MSKPKPRLGRGLNGILSGGKSSKADNTSPNSSAPARKAMSHSLPPVEGYKEIDVSSVVKSPYQPRKEIHPDALQDLANSIRSEGLLQPIVVRPTGKGYELIAGERRLQACRLLKMKRIPARVMQTSDASSATLTLIENLQREQLNPVEEALGFASLMKDFGLKQEETAERVGKARATIANSLRLLDLSREIQGYLSRNLISTGHAKVLLGLKDETLRSLLARRIVEDGLSVRDTEKQIRNLQAKSGSGSTSSRNNSPETNTAIESLEKDLEKHLRATVQLKHSGKKGRIIITYTDSEDLERILQQIGVKSS